MAKITITKKKTLNRGSRDGRKGGSRPTHTKPTNPRPTRGKRK